MAKVSKGTQLYFIDPDDDSVVEVQCVTDFDSGGEPRDNTEHACLNDDAVTNFQGIRRPGQATAEIAPDSSYASHIRMWELFNSGSQSSDLKWVVGWSDGTDAPTVDSSGEWDLPTTRTWYKFQGYIQNMNFNHALGQVVTGSVPIQKSGDSEWAVKV